VLVRHAVVVALEGDVVVDVHALSVATEYSPYRAIQISPV
jgi:hypothetical protein